MAQVKIFWHMAYFSGIPIGSSTCCSLTLLDLMPLRAQHYIHQTKTDDSLSLMLPIHGYVTGNLCNQAFCVMPEIFRHFA